MAESSSKRVVATGGASEGTSAAHREDLSSTT